MTRGMAVGAAGEATTTAGPERPAGAWAAARAADKLRQATALVKAAVALSVPEETAPSGSFRDSP